MRMSINHNEPIKVRLTEYGKDILIEKEFERALSGKGSVEDVEWANKEIAKIKDNEYYSTSFWSFCNIFGEHMFIGSKDILKDGEVIFFDRESKIW